MENSCKLKCDLVTMSGVILHKMTQSESDEKLIEKISRCEGNPFEIVKLVQPFFQNVELDCDLNSIEKGEKIENGRHKKEKETEKTELKSKPEESEENTEKEERQILKMKTFTDDLFTLKSPNQFAPALEDFVEIRYAPNRGRHVVIKKDVPIGTVILVEKPFAFILENSLSKIEGAKKSEEIGTNCHRCLKWLPSNSTDSQNFIPCSGCNFAVFCSEECAIIGHSVHKFECPSMKHFNAAFNFSTANKTEAEKDEENKGKSANVMNLYLAFKLICSLGPQKLLEIFQSSRNDKNSPFSFDETKLNSSENDSTHFISGSDPSTSIYDSNSYLPIFHLVSEKKFKYPQIIPLAVTTLAITQILDKNTHFFTNIETKHKEEFKIFVSALMLRHFENIQSNVYSLSHFVKYPDGKIDLLKIGRGLFPTASLFNHSCDPNVTRFFDMSRFGSMVVVALKPLKKDEELCISYTLPFYQMEREERQNTLQISYNFTCSCVACTEKWPVAMETENNSPVVLKINSLCCPDCSIAIPCSQRTKEKMKVVSLRCRPKNPNLVSCPKCECNFNYNDILDLFDKRRKMHKICKSLADSNFPLVILKNLVAILEFYHVTVKPPSEEISRVEETFKETFRRVIYYSNSNI